MAFGIFLRKRISRQRPNPSLRKQDIAMSLGIQNAALVRKEWNELSGRVENIGEFLGDPPRVLTKVPIVMVATANPVHIAGIERVAPLIEQCAIASTVS